MKRVLVTGARGFVGRHTLAPLVERGYEVHAVTRREPPANSPAGTGPPQGVRWHRLDLLDPAAPSTLIADVQPTHLLHLAWYAEPGAFWESPLNVGWLQASLGLLAAFAAGGGSRVVAAGTCAEYDWQSPERMVEALTPVAPRTLYGTAKHALHQVAEALAAQPGRTLSVAWGRLFFLYGPGEHPARLVSSVITSLLRGEAAACTHGRQVRDFLHSADVGAALVALLDSPVTGAVNIASGQPVSVAELVQAIGAATGHPELLRMGALPERPGEPAELVADVTRLGEEVGWHPTLSLERGLARTVAWWREQSAGRS